MQGVVKNSQPKKGVASLRPLKTSVINDNYNNNMAAIMNK